MKNYQKNQGWFTEWNTCFHTFCLSHRLRSLRRFVTWTEWRCYVTWLPEMQNVMHSWQAKNLEHSCKNNSVHTGIGCCNATIVMKLKLTPYRNNYNFKHRVKTNKSRPMSSICYCFNLSIRLFCPSNLRSQNSTSSSLINGTKMQYQFVTSSHRPMCSWHGKQVCVFSLSASNILEKRPPLFTLISQKNQGLLCFTWFSSPQPQITYKSYLLFLKDLPYRVPTLRNPVLSPRIKYMCVSRPCTFMNTHCDSSLHEMDSFQKHFYKFVCV